MKKLTVIETQTVNGGARNFNEPLRSPLADFSVPEIMRCCYCPHIAIKAFFATTTQSEILSLLKNQKNEKANSNRNTNRKRWWAQDELTYPPIFLRTF